MLICPYCKKLITPPTKTKIKILQIIRKGKGISIREIWKRLNTISYKGVYNHIKSLENIGLVNITKHIDKSGQATEVLINAKARTIV